MKKLQQELLKVKGSNLKLDSLAKKKNVSFLPSSKLNFSALLKRRENMLRKRESKHSLKTKDVKRPSMKPKLRLKKRLDAPRRPG